MIWTFAIAVFAVIAAGTYLALSRDLLRCLIGLALLGSGVNLLLFASGRLSGMAPPIIPAGERMLQESANPVPQALVLTAIVIGLALLFFSLVLGVRLIQLSRRDDVNRLRIAEPVPDEAPKPPLEEP